VLYLKSMSIDRFKSFKHISVLFNKGFNCIVGPNGSGKSNIVDALFFSLGESSLRRLRVDRLQYLIRESSTRKTQSMATAHVKLELEGDEKVEITRGIRADGKTVYRLNGKRMTRQEVLEVLKKHNVRVDETSTIAQGEINKIIEANAKQRREFIDIAAGIQEFESKKKEALSELEKVGIKVSTAQAMLNERLTYLNELAKDKEAAEKFILMTKRLKSLSYSILTKRKKTLQLALEGYSGDIAKLEAEKKGIGEKLAEYAKKITELSEERQRIAAMLNDSTTTLDGANKKMTEIESELSALEVKIGTGNATIEDCNKLIAALGEEIKGTEEKVRANQAEIARLGGAVAELEAKAKKFSTHGSSGDGGRRVKELDAEIAALEKEMTLFQEKLSKLQTESTLVDARKENALKESAKIVEEIKSEAELLAESKEKAEKEGTKREQATKKANSLQARGEDLRNRLSSLDSEILSLKEQRASAHSREGLVQGKLKSVFAKNPGFYGTAAELCTYDGKYAEAVEAAAGSRFNYFVVESMDVANEMIQYLRKQNAGRATFIPLRELKVEQEQSEKGLQPVTGLLDYDKKYEKVFTYIFSNTYLVNDVEEAKSLGTGRRRYVTLSGETVERAGVLSGGSRLKMLSLAAIEKRLKELEDSKAGAFAEAKDVDRELFASRSESARAELEMASAIAALQGHKGTLESKNETRAKLEQELAGIGKESEKLAGELEKLADDSAQKAERLSKMKQDRSSAYDLSLETARKGMSKADMDQQEKLNKEAEGMKLSAAQMEQANKMFADAIVQRGKELKEKKELFASTKKAISEGAKRKAELIKAKEQIEAHLKRSSKSNKEAIERQEAIDKEKDRLVNEQALANAKGEGMERQMGEIKVRQGTTDQRLNDITAELSAYGNAEIEFVDGDVEKMEKEQTGLSAKIEALGNVNLKAPEDYEQKARSVNEATEKVNTLEGEKRAVLAMIEEIDSKKLNAFITTYTEVSKNFSKLYNYIFPGKARIELEDMNEPLSTGLSIKIEDTNFVGQSRGLSGGQKSLISLMLLFAIHMCKPSSIYLFDEIDTALDKENSKKLSQLVREMAKDAQFIVVSHNDSLIVNADAALGVTKSGGDSQVYGIEISNIRKQ
jgi:chromosome segregation protein